MAINCYRLFTESVTWFQAQAACQKKESSLATLNDGGVNTFVRSLTTQTNGVGSHYHIGGYEVNVSNWAWTDGSSTWDYENWSPSSPSNHGGCENCLTLIMDGSYTGWNDIPCNTLAFPYICSKPFCVPEVSMAAQAPLCCSSPQVKNEFSSCCENLSPGELKTCERDGISN